MKFCKKCKNYMKISEIDKDNKRDIYYTCNQCNYIESTNQYNIFKKNYKQVKKDIIQNPEFSNFDKTLPRKNTKCPYCKYKQDNVYYQNNNLTITLVCSKCEKTWIYS